ncbi:MAG: inositol monophosphatase [SAR202 cluster bacterium]|nr:inositol monophosphatase [SAR202 cluster bacterium]
MNQRFSPPSLPPSRSGRTVLQVAEEAARIGGRIIRERFLTAKEISFKGRANIVTDVDVASEREILGLLQAEYPEFGILSEESAPIETGSPYAWVIDPLDGTRNYASGIPHFCVVVALAQGEEIVAGITYDPMREELFTAQAGQGAFLNGNALQVSRQQEMGQCLLGFDLGYVDEKAGLAIDMVRSLWPGFQSMRLMGSSALGLAYAAAGRVDIYFHHALAPWDVASGLLLVREAGGEVVDRQGRRSVLHTPSVIAASPHLIARFLAATEGTEWRRG